MVSDIDKEAAAIATTEVVDEQPEVARRAEINLPKPDKETAATTTVAETTTTAAAGELPPQDIVEQQQQQPETNQISEDAAERGVSKLQIKTAVVTAKREAECEAKGGGRPQRVLH